ncbi:MAG: fibronectin type III domain-containing protein [Paludibacteraceae bacterium]|nr:fibronectin type III domain-containing protein [Paludibacteraceae bacterium]
MKKFLLLLTLFCAFFSTARATEVEIGADDPNQSNISLLPINALWKYGWSQQIFTSDEIGMAGTINSITLQLYHSGANPPSYSVNIYMAEVSEDVFATTSSWVSLGASDLVFSGTTFANLPTTATDMAEFTIDLDNPFVYSGSGNLLIAFANNTGSYVSGLYAKAFGVTSDPKRALYKYQDSGAIDPTNPNVAGTLYALRNVITLDITGSGGGPICDKPTSCDITDITANSATVNFAGGSQTYNVEYKAAGDADWTSAIKNTTLTSIPLTDLMPNTSYQVRVQSVCGDNTSGYKSSASFQTLIGLPFGEKFNGSSAPDGWSVRSGKLNDDGSATLSSGYGWSYTTGNGVFDKHARAEIYSTSCYKWLILPEIPIPAMEEGDLGYQLTFNVALTAYSGTLQPATKGAQSDDRFIVLASLDGGANWNILQEWNNAGSAYVYDDIACTADGDEIAIDISTYAGQSIILAFYGESTSGPSSGAGDNYLHIDNVLVDRIPTCLKPTGLHDVQGAATTNSIQVAWTANSGEIAWHVQYKPSDNSEADWTTFDADTNPYTINGLQPFTNYDVRVAAVCSETDVTDYCKPIKAKTATGVPYEEKFDTTALPGEWKRYEVLLEALENDGAPMVSTVDGWDVGAANGVFPAANNHLLLNIAGADCKYWIVSPTIVMAAGYQLTFDLALTQAAGSSPVAVASGGQNDDKFIVFISSNGGESWNPILTWDNAGVGFSYDAINPEGQLVTFDLSSYAGQSILIAFYGESTEANGNNNLHIANFKIAEIPACQQANSLVITDLEATSATAVWTSDDVEANWQYGLVADPAADFAPADEDFVNNTSAFVAELTGLSEKTNYAFFLRRACEGSNSEPLVKNFRTPAMPLALPWSENFDTLTSGIPEGWDNSEGTTTDASYKWNKYTDSDNTCLRFNSYNNSNGKTNVLATPRIYLSEDAILSFRWKNPKGGAGEVLISNDGGATRTALVSNLTGISDWKTYEINLSAYSGSKVIIYFAATSNWGSGDAYLYLDDVAVAAAPDCLKPSGLAISDITATSATLVWNSETDGFPWVYAYAPASEPEPADDAFIDINVNSIELEGLEDCTSYKFYLRKNCGAEAKSESVAISFQTKQVTVDAGDSYSEDFEGEAKWLFNNGDLANAWVIGTAVSNGEGSHALYISNDGGATHAYTNSAACVVFAQKAFNFAAGNYVFSYDWLAQGESTYDFIRVALVPADVELVPGTALPAGVTYQALPDGCIALDGGSKLNLSNTWQTFTSDEVAVPAGTYNIVILWRDDTSGGTNPPAAIDNFSFAKIACAMPDDFHAVDSLATTTSVVLKWTQMSEEDDFVIRYKVYGEEAFADSIFVLNDDSTTLTGLVPGTAYELQVAAWCDPDDATAIGKYSASIYALTKCAAVASINQDFDGALLCWSYIQETNSFGTYPGRVNAGDDALSAPNALYFLSEYGSSAVDQYAILPELISLDNMRIKFSVRKESAVDEATYAIVGVMTDKDDVSTFEALDSIAVDAIEYAEHIVEFGAYTGAGKYVAIKMPASAVEYATLLIDNVVVEEIPQCLDPQGLNVVADGITSSSALLAWAPQGSEADWLVRYRISGAADWADTIHVNNDTLLLENLAGATIYEAQVAAWCDPTDDEALSPFSSSLSFTTACGIISTFPWHVDFESFAASTVPTCWDNSASTSETLPSNPERIWGVYEYDDNKMIRMYNYYVKSGQAVINTPAIALPAEAYELSFDYAHTASCGAMVVRISTDDGANWTALEPSYAKNSTGDQNNPGTFQEAVVNLDAYAGQTILIQFYSVANYGSGAIFVDNIDIHKAPSCIKPQGLEAILTKGDGSVATLSWSAGASEEAWVVEYSRNADMSEAISLPANDTALAISGLLSDSIYYARVKAVCDETDQSDWSAQISFIPTNAIIINDSTASSSYVPFYGYYANYSANSQFIVPAAEIEALMWDSITKLTFYSTSSYPNASWGSAQWEVYIAPTNASSLSALNDWSKMSLAKSAGTLSVVNSQMVITLDHPFVYEGGNLVIGFKQVTAGSGSSCTWYGKTGASGSSYYSYTSSYSTSSNTSTFRPKVRFDYIEGAEPSCYKVKDFVVSGITASSVTIGWTNGSEDQEAWQIAYSCDPNFDIAEATPVDIASNPYALSGLLTDTLYNVYVRANCGEGGYSAWNSISFRTAKACQTPDDLVAAPGLNTAEISWNTYGQTGFNLRYKAAADADWTILNDAASPQLIEGLAPSTSYQVQVQAACESEDSWSAVINFQTAYGTPFEEKFATTSIPADWARYSGLLEDVLDGEALTTTTSGWNFGTANGVFNNHAKINIYGTSYKYWLATPAVYVSDNVQLTFDLALTKFSGTLTPVEADAQADDKFAVLISTDNGDNWSVLRLWDNAGSEYVYNNIACSATGEPIAIDLSAYDGQAIKIAFYGESTETGGDNNLHIDNVLIDKVPTCLKPTGFSISDVKAHSAQLNWTAGDEGQSAWQIAIDTIAAFNPDTLSNLIDVTENPYVLAGLAPETRYYAYVRANCGATDGVSRWTDVQTFKTTIACPAPSALKAVLTPGDGSIATLSWKAGQDEAAWIVEYSLNSNLSDSIEVPANDTFVNLSGLTAEATYYARVKADCGELDGESLYSAIISFKPTDAYELLLNDGTATNEYVPIYGYWTDNYTRSQFIIPAEQLESLEWDSLTVLTFYSSSTNTNWDATAFEVYVAEVPETTMTALTDWNAMTKVMNEASLNIIDNQMVITFDEAYQYQGGNLLIGIKQTASTASANAKHTYWYGVSANGASFGGYGDGNNVAQRNFLPKMLINYVPGVAPACPNPKNLAVSGITDSEATFSWKAVEGATWEYALVQGAAEPASFISTEENSVTIADLAEATDYTFYLRRACGDDGYSDATLSVAFTTDVHVDVVPFVEDFEGNGSWKFVNGSEPNAWVIGNAANNGGEKALYISNNNGADNTYTKDDAVSASFATILLNFDQAGEYTFAYDWKANGDYNEEEGELYDYLRVVLVPASATLEAGNPALPDGYIALDNGGLYGATDWQHHSSDAEVEAGQYKLVFAWFNDESDGEDAPAAIDNISIQEKGPETGLEGNAGIFNNGKAFKFLRDNKVFILVNGVIYDATGRKVEVVK